MTNRGIESFSSLARKESFKFKNYRTIARLPTEWQTFVGDQKCEIQTRTYIKTAKCGLETVLETKFMLSTLYVP